jgi:hypothetical protein
LKQNYGLYTQCENEKQPSSEFCFGCKKEAIKNENGKPNYGTIQDRQQVGLMEFRDPKGKAPTHYTKIMKKMNYTKEQVLEEAKNQNKRIDEMHLETETKRGRPKKNEKVDLKEQPVVEEKKKGRPKKSKKTVEEEEVKNDLFAELIEAASNEKEKKDSKEEKAEVKNSAKKERKSKKEPKPKKKNEKKVEVEELTEELEEEELEEEEESDIVKKIVYEGKTYLQSKNRTQPATYQKVCNVAPYRCMPLFRTWSCTVPK